MSRCHPVAGSGRTTPELAVIAIGLVITTNTLSKLGFARAGGWPYFLRLAPGLLLLIASFWIGWWILLR